MSSTHALQTGMVPVLVSNCQPMVEAMHHASPSEHADHAFDEHGHVRACCTHRLNPSPSPSAFEFGSVTRMSFVRACWPNARLSRLRACTSLTRSATMYASVKMAACSRLQGTSSCRNLCGR